VTAVGSVAGVGASAGCPVAAGVEGGLATGGGGPALRAAGRGLGVEACLAVLVGAGAELVRLAEAGTIAGVLPLTRAAGGRATVRWCVRWLAAGGDTTTFSAGAGLEPEPDRIGGRRTVPESRSSAIAAAPRASGITGAATRRTSTHNASHFPRSLADTGLFSPSRTSLTRPWPRDTRNAAGRQPAAEPTLRCFRPNH
jgi:hypothetical protein